MKFNICVLRSSVHTRCFDEMVLSLEWALQQLGHEVVRTAAPRSDAVNILFGVRPLDTVPPGSIIYNGEQVGWDGLWPDLFELYKKHTVWDYSAENAKRYKDWQVSTPVVVRPGHCPLLDDGRFDGVPKTHDVVFFGSLNPRRVATLKALGDLGMSVLVAPFGVYGAERDALIASARLCINIHYYEASIFEAVRCSYLAQCGMPVLTETSRGSENELWGIVSAGYSELADAVQREIAKGDLAAYSAYLREKSKQVSLLDDVRAAVESLQSLQSTQPTPSVEFVTVPDNIERRTQHDVTLCMIVKNEKDVIERCLSSVKPFINRWSIVDTGSTDGTQDTIRNFMRDIPGTLHECPWKEFDGSRSESVSLARAECGHQGWLLMIDADESLQVDGDLKIPEGYDCFNAWVTFGEGVRWARPMLARANKPWFFEMPRHEALYCQVPAPTCPHPINGALIMSTREGARAKEDARERFTRDAKVLETWALKHPGHARCTFYIAQSYYWAAYTTVPPDRGLLQKAVTYYLQRAEMPNDHPQETFSARYLAAQCMVHLGYPWERIQHTFLQAYSIGTSRAEPLYNIARHYRQMGDQERAAGKPSAGQYALAELFARKACQIGPTDSITADVDHSVNEWRAKDELATALTYLSGHAEARELFRHILLSPRLPPDERERIQVNLEMCRRVAPDPA